MPVHDPSGVPDVHPPLPLPGGVEQPTAEELEARQLEQWGHEPRVEEVFTLELMKAIVAEIGKPPPKTVWYDGDVSPSEATRRWWVKARAIARRSMPETPLLTTAKLESPRPVEVACSCCGAGGRLLSGGVCFTGCGPVKRSRGRPRKEGVSDVV